MNEKRRRPQDFLEIVQRARQGRLKIYLGFAAGVGKTYRMLQEAHALSKRGVDIVIGAVDTHGRPETAELIPGLEVVPLKAIEYRGFQVHEMDLEAVINRAPAMAIVDEVAHTNAPGSRNKKRYKDILDLLEAGVNVLCAFNIQHLESLNDIIFQATGVRVRETVPDTFLERADQIVNVDLPVEDLLERLKIGKIFSHEKIPWALEGFFKSNNLQSLREMTFREIADSLEREVNTQRMGEPPSSQRLGAERVMVCISSMPTTSAELMRKGSRMAGRLNTHWYVVYVETPGEGPDRISSEAQRHLLDNFQLANDLGAEVVRLHGRDPVEVSLEFARMHNVGHIVIGRSRRALLPRLMGLDHMHRMVARASGFDLLIVSLKQEKSQ